jgi:photosynthetic reaction center cytochrome c subunit
MTNQRVARCLSGCVLILAIVFLLERNLAAQQGTASAAQGGSGQKLAEEQFKNIQVLKGIPADQLIPAMQFISASLGVDCEHCHNHEAMDSDEKKPKKVARQMITMMREIDKNNFEGRLEVTCYTCHRGERDPVSIPMIREEDMVPPTNKPMENTSLPKAEDLLDKYLAAVGGAPALEKIKSRVQSGKLHTSNGQTFPADIYAEAPNRRAAIMHLQAGDSITAYNGERGWMAVPARPSHVMSAAEAQGVAMDADMQFAEHVRNMYEKFRVENGEKIDGHDTYLVSGRGEGKAPLRLYLDKESGLLLRLTRYSQSPLGLNPTQIDYSDYREADGVKVPFRWSVSRPGNRFTIDVEKMEQNVPIGAERFTPPPPPPAAATP